MFSTALRNSARRNILNKRFASTAAESSANQPSGGNNGVAFLALLAAGGAGYYLYQTSVGKLVIWKSGIR